MTDPPNPSSGINLSSLTRQISVEAGAAPLSLYISRTSTSAPEGSNQPLTGNTENHNHGELDTIFSAAVTPAVKERENPMEEYEIEPERLVGVLEKHLRADRESGESKFKEGEGEGEGGRGIETKGKLSKTRMVLLGVAMMLTYFIGAATSSAVVLTIPSMAKDLGISELSAQWVSSAFSLAYGCGLLFAGRLADIYGRKILFVAGVSIYLVFSIISAVIKVHIALCVIRALAGLGLAIASPAGFGIIGVNFREEPERTIAFAVFGLGNPVGAVVGMVLGGVISGAGRHGWSYLYYLLGGIAVFPVIIGILVIPKDAKINKDIDSNRRIDWLGAFLVTSALCLLSFSITQSGIVDDGWRTPYIPVVLVISIILFVLFGFWENYVEHRTSIPPIAKISLLTRNGWRVTMVMISTFAVFICVIGFVYSTSLYYQSYKGLTPLGNSVRLLPAPIAGMFACVAVMWLAPRFRAPYLLMVGSFLSGLANLLYAVQPEGATYWGCEFVGLLCLPFGTDLAVGVGSIVMSNLCREDEQSVAGALFQTSVQIGSAFGICLSSLLTVQLTNSSGSLLHGLRGAFYMQCAWGFVGALIIYLSLRTMGLAKNVSHGFH